MQSYGEIAQQEWYSSRENQPARVTVRQKRNVYHFFRQNCDISKLTKRDLKVAWIQLFTLRSPCKELNLYLSQNWKDQIQCALFCSQISEKVASDIILAKILSHLELLHQYATWKIKVLLHRVPTCFFMCFPLWPREQDDHQVSSSNNSTFSSSPECQSELGPLTFLCLSIISCTGHVCYTETSGKSCSPALQNID